MSDPALPLSANAVSADDLNRALATPDAPVVIDVRRRAAFDKADSMIATAVWRDHADAADWAEDLPEDCAVVVYCVHGHAISQSAAATLRALGIDAYYLDGGIDHFIEAGGITIKRGLVPDGRSSIWVTRERPKIDRIACPWLIRRFIDPDAVFHYVAKDFVKDVATETGGVPYDIPDVAFSHVGEKCSFDAFVVWSGIQNPAMDRLADIVRGADTGRLDLAPECAGLLAMSLGLSALYEDDDLAMLDAGMAVYDALFAWARHAAAETHNWVPKPA
ncbi:chromate resistance protein [Thalassospiraceae bacterium LMO-SO8]|nr:chromate resistance protein [Alphaproteobacteria bacterium LMO-S08]WND76081.1 chromate resistance protein [Thalassospiraceae bacterium LMO-SO8]